jgi:hypothetical protein
LKGTSDEANRIFFFHGAQASALPVLPHRGDHISGHIKSERGVIAPLRKTYGRTVWIRPRQCASLSPNRLKDPAN